MIKVVLADDDTWILQGLVKLINWEENNMEVVGAFSDGFSTLEYVNKNGIDMLITDIAMPGMSGLVLAKRIKEILPEIFIFILSGHEDFDYARQAISLKAVDYIVKPVNYSELGIALKEFSNNLLKLKETSNENKVLKESMELIQNSMIVKWMEGKLEYAEITNSIKSENKHFTHKAMIAIIEVSVTMNIEFSNMIIKELISELVKYDNIIVEKYTTNKIIFISNRSSRELEEFLTKLINIFRLKYDIKVTIGMSSRKGNVVDYPLLFQEADKALSSKMFVGTCKVISYNKDNKINNKIKFNEKISHIIDSINDNDMDRIKKFNDQLFIDFWEVGDRKIVYNTLSDFFSKLEETIKMIGEDLYSIVDDNMELVNIMYEFDTLDDIKNWLVDILAKLVDYLTNIKSLSAFIRRVDKYITNNIENNITLKELSEHFNISPNYMSHLIKKELEQSFTEYVNNKRLEKVAELLRNSNLKIYEIAEKFGYVNMTNFYNKFKEKYGVSPKEYQKK